VLLDLPSLEWKLLRDRRGGYCFEQNLLFSHALKALGFHVTGLAARVLWDAPEAVLKARTHMLLRIELEGASYLADVGFGVLTPTAPLRLEPDSAQSTPHESFRLLRAAAGFVMQAQVNGLWKSLYVFDLQEQLQPDYEVVNWYLSNHPDSRFVNELMVARPAPGRRITLRNLELTVHYLDGNSEQRSIRSGAELRAILKSVFDLTLPETPELDATLARLAGSE
jgi:N-hydroxyarylamine O-acetyltransferase